MGDTDVDPYPHIIWSNIECPMVKFDGLVCSSKVSEGGSYFIHEEIVSGIQIEGSVEEIDGYLIFSFDEEENGTS